MKRDDFLRLLEDELEIADVILSPEVQLSDLEAWDSLAAVEFIAIADEQFEIQVAGTDLEKCETVNDLLLLLNI